MIRLGVVAFLNMQPLIFGLQRTSQNFEILTGPPSVLAAWLERGEVDVAMVPVAAIFRNPQWRIVPSPSGASALAGMIGSRGPVRSVLVVGPQPMESWNSLRPDPQSQTSNALAQIILRRRLERKIAVVENLRESADAIPLQAESETAEVIIGSKALRWLGSIPDSSRSEWISLDLGEEWTTWTGLPFVNALWAVRPGISINEVATLLEAAREKNMQGIAAIAAAWPELSEDRLSVEEARDYLTKNIQYDFDAAALQGLELFYELGLQQGIFPQGWRFEWAR